MWVVKFWNIAYFTGNAYAIYPYAKEQRKAARYFTKELAEAAIAPRITCGHLCPKAFTVHRLVRKPK